MTTREDLCQHREVITELHSWGGPEHVLDGLICGQPMPCPEHGSNYPARNLTVADLERLPEGTIVHTADADYKRVRVVWADTNVGWRKAHRSTGRVVAGTTPLTSSLIASMGAQRT